MTPNPYACNEDCTGLRLNQDGSKTVSFIIRVAPPGGYDGPHLQDRVAETGTVVAHFTSWTANSKFQVCIRTFQSDECKIELFL